MSTGGKFDTGGYDSSKYISDLIFKAVKEEVDTAIGKIIEEARAKIGVEVRKSAANIAMSVFSHYDVQKLGETVTISVRNNSVPKEASDE